MAVTRFAENVFMIGEGVTILAASNTPFIQFCRIVETLEHAQGSIVQQYLVPLQTTAQARHTEDDDEGLFSDDDMSNPLGGLMSAIGSMFGGGSSTDDTHTRDDPESVAGQLSGAGTDDTRSIRDGRTMDQRAQDRVVSEGTSAVDGTVVAGHVRRRGEGTVATGGDGSTYHVAEDDGAGVVHPVDSGGAAFVASAAAGSASAAAPATVSGQPPVHGSVAVPVADLHQRREEELLLWFTVERVSLWEAFQAYNMVSAVDGSLMAAIQTGSLDASPGDDLMDRLNRWSSARVYSIIRSESAIQQLIETMTTNRGKFGDEEVARQLELLLNAVTDSRKTILPNHLSVERASGTRT